MNAPDAALTITEFLEARIAEEEELAGLSTGDHWHGQACEVRTAPGSDPQWFRIAAMHHANHYNDARHIARHDPARVLAECAAKRAIVQYVVAARADRSRGDAADAAYRAAWWTATRLASVYADHPDYQQEWSL